MCMFLKYVLNSILMNCLKSPIITFTLQMKELNVRENSMLFLATVVEVKVKENFRTRVYLVWHQISDDVCVNHQYGWNIRF